MKNEILQGDVLAVLKTIPDNYVNCCVTSPPYWGLRDYGHSEQIGLEKTPELYVAKMVEVFNQVKRVLKPDGTLWLNLGDSYSNASPGSGGKCKLKGAGRNMTESRYTNIKRDVSSIKPKDLIGIPWMVAFALRSAGWYLRSDIIWHKPNPMPESVTDRPTKSHEYIFLMSKSGKYYYDYEAIQTPLKDISLQRLSQDIKNQKGSSRVPGKTNGNMKAVASPGRNPRPGIDTRGGNQGSTNGIPYHKNLQSKGQQAHSMHKARLYGISGTGFDGHSGNYDKDGNVIGNGFANKKSVWTVPTKPYKEAHFATFPQDLIIDCIKAGCPVGGIVLDPFMGAGTTAIVAKKLNRNYIGIELNPKYISIAEKRIEKELGVLFE